MSLNQQDHIMGKWIFAAPGTVAYSSGSVEFSTLAEQIEINHLSGTSSNCSINHISIDSRSVTAGSLFIALSGSVHDGHDYIEQAMAQSCTVFLVERGQVKAELLDNPDICIYETSNSREAYGQLAEILFDHPSDRMTMFGITGTNGKTSITYLLESVLRASSQKTGVLGTVNYRYYDSLDELIQIPSSHTTPDPLLLQQILRKMADNGVESVIMEISSHGLEQNRIGSLVFDVAAFTHLSRDHLDYHTDMSSYFTAKSLLFTKHLREGGKAVITHSGEERVWSEKMEELCLHGGVSVIRCGDEKENDISLLSAQVGLRNSGIDFQTPSGMCSFVSPLVGDFNVTNLQTACAMAIAAGIPVATISKALSTATGAPGRMQRVVASRAEQNFRPSVFVDYAHTPDALEQILKTASKLPHGELFCVFGCGGDRDIGKRPVMGAVAGKYADVVILTDDNPRSEDSETILENIVQGLDLQEYEYSWLENRTIGERGYVIIPDRHQAIATAVSNSTGEDIVLVAGKGHENYQLTSKGKRYFDDSLEVAQGLSNWNIESIIQATKGKCIGACKSRAKLASINTDSRTIQPGDIFVALKGERFDAHDYLEQVVEAKAGCLIVDHEPQSSFSIPVIQVEDTEQALGNLARYRRTQMKELFAPTTVGITGSSGKTTVKEMCAAIFNTQWPEQADAPSNRVLKTRGNFNNLIGLPLSLLPISAEHKAVILEMGMNVPGEIARLTDIADPDIACINNVHGAHLQGLGDIEGVAKAKAELFQGCGPDTILVVNTDDQRVYDIAQKCDQRKIYFGISSNTSAHLDVYATHCKVGDSEDISFVLHIKDDELQVLLQVPGVHNISNALAAAAIATTAGIGIQTILAGLESFKPTDKRMQVLDGPAGSRIINDTYNANPESMKAGIATLGELGSESHIAVLGDMLELGPESAAFHREIGKTVAMANVDFLAVIGDFAKSTADGAIDSGMNTENVYVFEEKEECLSWLKGLCGKGIIKKGSYILVKGSRGMRLEQLVERLTGEQ